MRQRVLVCVLAQTRGHEATWAGFNRNLLEELGADLALCIGTDEGYDFSNPFWQNARYRWSVPELEDFGHGFDQARTWFTSGGMKKPADWRDLMTVQDQWLGGIKGPGQHPGSGAIQIYFRWLLYRHLRDEGLLQRYDRFIVTRSDFLWSVPHPPLDLLDAAFLWMPDGERYGGLTDRHLVASTADILPAINLIEEIVLRPKKLKRSMRGFHAWNVECFIRLHFERTRLSKRLRFFPYVMFAVRGESDTTRWAMGQLDEQLGLYVKYESERESARRYQWIRSSADWKKLAANEPTAFHGEIGPRPAKKKPLRRAKNLLRGFARQARTMLIGN